ncbi:hypothetical protein GPOL_c10540 [Gordonia polyisoprenivorans VH2]|uniref:DUF3093 domain-containing protein n=1 Tax=Gordonia polyisoprenivorans (strain DSM 44266 / VH2) TaxID=1112204 RepID=H6N0L2_GORPV|nr:hypothetical protein [Gordonia polyisoprenivorans]AFA72116.1 hypothetical protein GPOL_c10540 [Gordonia polyisoprenivorans VH2]
MTDRSPAPDDDRAETETDVPDAGADAPVADATESSDEAESPEPATPESESAEPESAEPDPHPIPEDRGEVLFYEPGGSWWVVAIGPVLIGAVLAMEISGPGQVHWPVLIIFGLIIIGFSVVQVIAARRHVSVELTELTLRQGVRIIALDEIDTIYPENNGPDAKDWESARALGELHGVPRRRRGIGLKLADGSLAQAWARDVQRFRRELTEAHTAVALGLPPRGSATD